MTQMLESFFLKCVAKRCIVVPVPTYAQWGTDGNINEQYFTGIRYVALPFDEQAVSPDYYIYIEEGQTGYENLYSTPEDALGAYVATSSARTPSTG
jgi:hypothetical protein